MFVVGLCFIIPMYYTNVWNAAYLPINSNDVFDNTGNQYNISRVLNEDFTLDVTAYENYSPAYLSTANGVVYSAFFAVYLATIVYVFLYHYPEIKAGFRSVIKWTSARDENNDIHNRLMRAYKEVPEWWYLSLLGVSFVLACVCCSHYDTGMPIWGIVFAIGLCLVLQIPIGIINAVTNVEITNNVLAEFIGGKISRNFPP